MPSTTEFEFGDVLLVPFPFTDQTTTKRRPAVVVSSAVYNRDKPDLIVMAITSQLRRPKAVGDVAVERWKQAGLLKASVIKPVVATLEKELVVRKLGRLEARDRQALVRVLTVILG